MNLSPLVQIAQASAQGWLTTRLLGLTLSSADWILWLLIGLSVLSVAVMLERLAYFSTRSLPKNADLTALLSRGDFAAAERIVQRGHGMEATVVREALAAAPQGADTVEEVIASVIARERPHYERSLSFLGTLGNNAPFIGLFGTVLGIIKAFHDLAGRSLQGTQAVMAGIA